MLVDVVKVSEQSLPQVVKVLKGALLRFESHHLEVGEVDLVDHQQFVIRVLPTGEVQPTPDEAIHRSTLRQQQRPRICALL